MPLTLRISPCSSNISLFLIGNFTKYKIFVDIFALSFNLTVCPCYRHVKLFSTISGVNSLDPFLHPFFSDNCSIKGDQNCIAHRKSYIKLDTSCGQLPPPRFISLYWVTQKLPQIYTANHANFSIQI